MEKSTVYRVQNPTRAYMVIPQTDVGCSQTSFLSNTRVLLLHFTSVHTQKHPGKSETRVATSSPQSRGVASHNNIRLHRGSREEKSFGNVRLTR